MANAERPKRYRASKLPPGVTAGSPIIKGRVYKGEFIEGVFYVNGKPRQIPMSVRREDEEGRG